MVPHLEAAAHHPPAHEALRASHEEEQPQALSQRPVHLTPCYEIQGWPRKRQPQQAAPHAVGILHPVDELELLQGHAPVQPEHMGLRRCSLRGLQFTKLVFQGHVRGKFSRMQSSVWKLHLFTILYSGDCWYFQNSSSHWTCTVRNW